MIQFKAHYVTNGTIKAKCTYSINERLDGRVAVVIYAKDYSRDLGKIFADEYENRTDSMTDLFDQGNVEIHADHPLYAAALARAQARKEADAKRWEAVKARRAAK